MSKVIGTFLSLPESLQTLAIELALTRARQDQYLKLSIIVEEAVLAANSALTVGVNPEPEAASCQEVTANGSNSPYVDPDVKKETKEVSNDMSDALNFLFRSWIPFGCKDGNFGPVHIYRGRNSTNNYKICNRGKSLVLESNDIDLVPYQAAVELISLHGKAYDDDILG